MKKKKWKVALKVFEKGGLYLEFRRGIGTYELSPNPYFYSEAIQNRKVLVLNSDNIGYRDACQELYRLYGDNWNSIVK
jgi:hypothetical protein